MRPERKAARERARNIKTAEDLQALIDSLNLTDEQRDIAIKVLGRGWSYARISAEMGYSIRYVSKQMERVYIKMS